MKKSKLDKFIDEIDTEEKITGGGAIVLLIIILLALTFFEYL